MSGSAERLLADHISQCPFEQITPRAIAAAKRSIIDGMAALIAGRQAEGVQPMLALAERWGGAQEARIYASGRKAPAPIAAWLNGAQMRALELDDCTDTLPLHPTAALLPALLATAEIAPLSGRGLLRALVVAQDLKIRFGRTITRDAMQTGRNNIFRVFATTAGVAAALGLNTAQTLNALGISASYGAGDAQCILEGSMALRVQFGNSASGAVISALLAADGVTGPVQFLTGRYGYLTAFEPEHDLKALLGDLGRRFEGENISVKPYAACRCTHSAIDLAMTLREQRGVKILDQIERIDIAVSPEVYRLVGRTQLPPPTEASAQFSLQFMTAIALLSGRAGLAETKSERLCDPAALSLARRINVRADERNRTAEVVGRTDFTVSTRSGEAIELSSDRPLGGPSRPLSHEALRAKLDDCAAHSQLPITGQMLDRFMTQIDALETEPLAAPVFDALA